MSTLKADTIQSTGGGAATLTKQSAAKAWADVNAAGTTINDSFNVSSFDDDGTGDGGANLTSNMGSANYSAVGQTDGNQGGYIRLFSINSKTSSAIEMVVGYQANDNGNDGTIPQDRIKMVTAHGDLA